MTSLNSAFNLRQTPEDVFVLTQIMTLTGKQKSQAVRGSVTLAYVLCSESRGQRVVVRSDNPIEQLDLYLGPGVTMASPSDNRRGSGYPILQVRFDDQVSEYLKRLRGFSFGTTMTSIIRRALRLYLEVIEHVRAGWILGYISEDHVFSRIVVPDLLGALLDASSDVRTTEERKTMMSDQYVLPESVYRSLTSLDAHEDLPCKGSVAECKVLYDNLAMKLSDSSVHASDDVDRAGLIDQIEGHFYRILDGLLTSASSLHRADYLQMMCDLELAVEVFYGLVRTQFLASEPGDDGRPCLSLLWGRRTPELSESAGNVVSIDRFRPFQVARDDERRSTQRNVHG